MPPMRTPLAAISLSLLLACSGLFGGQDAALKREAAIDAADEAEQARLRGDFDGAEAILKRRLAADPKDARAWRLLGDVNLTRGQRFQERWKENLGWAIDAYERSIQIDPLNCMTWGRLAASALSASENELTVLPRARLESWPLQKGWGACSGAVMLQIDLLRTPSEGDLAKTDSDAPRLARLAAAAPHMAEAFRRIDVEDLVWEQSVSWPDPAQGRPFVVLELPADGGSVDGSEPRRFTYPEWVVPSRVSGKSLIYTDRRFPSRVPARAVTQAPGCPGTEWDRVGVERMPVGQCVAGPQEPRASEIYDPEILRPVGVAHYHERSIVPAIIPWESVAEKSVTCLGGPVGRLFVEVPACTVSYDRAILQVRSLQRSAGLAALSEEHAERMVDAARGGALLGELAARKLPRGEVAVGLPYGMYVWSQPELTGCKGRGIFSKLEIVDGGLQFECIVGERKFGFRELAITGIGFAPKP